METRAASYDSVNYRWFAERYERFLYVDRVVVAAAQHGRGFGLAQYAPFSGWAVLASLAALWHCLGACTMQQAVLVIDVQHGQSLRLGLHFFATG